MLFNSIEFILFFLPVTLVVFFFIGNKGYRRIAISWLVSASLFFYGWWNPAYLGVIIGSIIFNYTISALLLSGSGIRLKKCTLTFGVTINLLLLGYFKYINFFISNVNTITENNFNIGEILLPLAISFFTFQQITYLVDTYKGETKKHDFLHYCLFVTFFPQLIAGPIVHHKEMLPQFIKDGVCRLNYQHLSVGITIFTMGLFKKVVLADGIAVYSTPIFDFADSGFEVGFFDAWVGVLAYTFQLYFDFSGYSDMAIGIARMFGIKLPLNFNSPYQSTNIIDFWRRWHITLSRFLRDYLYIPLGGSRKSVFRRQSNLLTTMLLGGLWHGAGWNFIIWGGLHGIFLMINHLWRKVISTRDHKLYALFSWLLTFIAVVFAWVPFRATTLDGALNMWKGMLGLQGISIERNLALPLQDLSELFATLGITFNGFFKVDGITMDSFIWIFLLFVISVFFPNTQQIMRRYRPAYETYKGEIKEINLVFIEWRPTIITLLITVITFFYSILSMSKVSEFLYFNF